jgi:pimeloyl-ACP methyl ester carboxylesterase
MRAPVNGVELCVETFGDPAHPAVLLIMGAAASMDRWEPPFCERLAAAGRFVIRYDHRDTGRSTTCPPGRPDYTGDDLSADALGLLDHLGIDRAHVVGLSAGGGIAQDLAIAHPGRLRTLTLLSTTAVSSDPDRPALPGMSAELQALFADPGEEPDWTDRDAVIAHQLEAERPYAGARGLDDAAVREVLGRAYDRSIDPASAGNHWLVLGGGGEGPPPGALRRLTVPALVVHGTHDPLFPLPHGEALAREIPGARLLVVDGLGHELPRWAWDETLSALIAHTCPRKC